MQTWGIDSVEDHTTPAVSMHSSVKTLLLHCLINKKLANAV